ncbi:MAG: glycosyltransferase [Lachnospiraceae bacterium]|nr:glycosyltransferase [Lachnospiraceae bacterium]
MENTGMNICLMNDSFPPLIDGVANAVKNYAYEINKKGGHAIVVTPEHPDADDEKFPFPVVRYPSIDMRNFVGYMAGIPFSPKLIKRLNQENVELIHSHCPFASAYLARQLRGDIKVPQILTYHTKFDVDIGRAVKLKVAKDETIKAVVSNVSAFDEVWAVSKGAGDNLRDLGYEGEIVVMDNGVDIPKGKVSTDVIDEKYDFLPKDLPIYLFVGRMMWYKGVRIILDALAALKDGGYDFCMVFIGSGADLEEMKAYAKEINVDDKVHFIGAVRDRDLLRAWYSRSDMLLFPSTYDTNGLVVREAAACSLPTVMIKDSCASEGVTDDVNGFLIRENAASLAIKLSKLHDNRDFVRKVGQGAVDDLYLSWEDAVSRALDRYQYVIEQYKLGKYKKHATVTDGMLKALGTLMSELSKIEKPRILGQNNPDNEDFVDDESPFWE